MRDGSRIRAIPHDNLLPVRAGQDGETPTAEVIDVPRDVEPVLREGMDSLRDNGRAIGCDATRRHDRRLPPTDAAEKSYA